MKDDDKLHSEVLHDKILPKDELELGNNANVRREKQCEPHEHEEEHNDHPENQLGTTADLTRPTHLIIRS